MATKADAEKIEAVNPQERLKRLAADMARHTVAVWQECSTIAAMGELVRRTGMNGPAEAVASEARRRCRAESVPVA